MLGVIGMCVRGRHVSVGMRRAHEGRVDGGVSNEDGAEESGGVGERTCSTYKSEREGRGCVLKCM